MAIGVTVPLKVLAQRVGASFLQARSIMASAAHSQGHFLPFSFVKKKEEKIANRCGTGVGGALGEVIAC